MGKSFGELHPELVSEWSDRNDPVTPYEVTYGSAKKFWWKGACGHEWMASPKIRHYGEKCPICANVRIIPGINDLATTDPELIPEWDQEKNEPLRPTDVSRTSAKRVWWICQNGHRWYNDYDQVTE